MITHARHLLRCLLAVLLAALCGATAAMAQSPFSGWSVDSGLGAPAIAWQQIDTRHSIACSLNVSPTAPGGSGSVAASRVLGRGRWLLSTGLSSASYSRLLGSAGQVGLTFTPASRFGLLQATLGAGFAAGNGVSWQGGLWPVSPGSAKDLMAGLRWAPAPLFSVHMAAHGGSLSEQEIGLNTALSPAFCFSIGYLAEQREGPGSLASLALRWQPQAGSAFALGLETDIAHQYWGTPLPGEGLAAGDDLLGLSRTSGQTATALVDAPLVNGLTLHVGASLPIGNSVRYYASATSAWTASVTHAF